MKKLFCILVLTLCLSYLSAQNGRPISTEIYQSEYFILNTPYNEPVNYEFYATDSIILEPSFYRHYRNHVYNCEMNLSINGIGIFPPAHGEQGGPNEGDAGYVGTLNGSIDVGAMGGAFYTIPIDLPAGINGMQPTLALTYNSQGGNGTAGWKWDLSGLSSITRTGQTLYHDGAMGGVTLSDLTDRFMLDGQRLFQVHDYGDSIDYKTEQDGLALIRAYTKEYSLFGQGPSIITIRIIENFKVWNPDGTILEYGFTDDSRIEPQNDKLPQALCWLLNKAFDRNGNAILYNYTESQETGEYYLESIEYTANDLIAVKPEFTVRFDYSNKNDYEFGYVQGSLVQKKKLLNTITVFKKGEIELMRYTLGYSPTSPNTRSRYEKNMVYHRLTSVTLEKDGKALNPIRITWEWDENNEYQAQCSQKKQLNNDNFNNFVFVGDFNADGFSDVITVPYKDEGDSLYHNPVDMNVLMNMGNGNFEYSSCLSMNNANGNPLATDLDWIHVVDINDDGYDDIILHYCNHLPNTESSRLMLYLNQQGEGFVPAWNTPIEIERRLYLAFGDFLGEGKQGAMVFWYSGDDNLPYVIPFLYITGQNMSASFTIISDLNIMNEEDISTGDFDGNGIDEIMMIDTLGATIYQLKYNEGNLVFEEKRRCYEVVYVPELNLFPGDYNGDGKTDLLCYGKETNASDLDWFFLFSTGDGFQYQNTELFNSYSMLPREKLFTYSLEKVNTNSGFALFSSDFDGDGICDIAISKKFGPRWCIDVFSKFVRSRDNNNQSFGYNPLSFASISGVKTRSQYIHAGNFYNKDNMSFLGNDVATKEKKPVLCTLFSLNEYNSVTCVTDGFGNKQRLSYRYPAIVGASQRKIDNDIVITNVPIRLLNSVTEYKINNAELTTQYNFEEAMLHKKGHGYLGFLSEVFTNSINGQKTSRKTTVYETETMGGHAFALPKEEVSEVFVDGQWRTAKTSHFEFQKVVCSLIQKVVKPAMIKSLSSYFNYDHPNNAFLRKEIVEYDYSFAINNTYQHAYNCTETRTGIDAHDISDYSLCEFKTTESIFFYQDDYNTWTLNRPHKRTVTHMRTGKPDVIHCWSYEYTAPDSYLPLRIYDIPSNTQDPLMTQTTFEYYDEGNLKKKTLSVPNAELGENTKVFEYEYGPGEGMSNQHRLVTKETVSGGNLVYQTLYSYNNWDQTETTTACNGLVTTYETPPLGFQTKTINADGTQSCTAMRWVEDEDPFAPKGALYYKWSRSSGSQKTVSYYHKTGVELRTVTLGMNGEAIFIDKNYDLCGRLMQVSNPYHPGETLQWTTYGYDCLDRLISTTTPDSTITSITYNGNTTTTAVVPTAGETQTCVTTVNAMGWTVRSDDASENSYVTYDHYADGLLASAKVNNDITTTITATYDNARNRRTLTDPNYGTLTTVYNAYGELRRRISPREWEMHKETEYLYDGLGRLVRETNEMENTTTHYIFDEEAGPRKGTLKELHYRTLDSQRIQYISYLYDDYARPVKTIETRPGGSYETQTSYDEYSRVIQTVYPSGVIINREYLNGYLHALYNADNQLLWRTDKANAFGQLVDATLGNGARTHRAYKEDMHYIDSIVTSNNLQNLSFGYDNFGNLASRRDNLRNLEETFHYDKMNRLTDIYLGNTHSHIVYDPLGRMTDKQADGQTVFANASFAGAPVPPRPHALKSAESPDGVFPAARQDITYTSFDKVSTIAEGDNTLAYTYGYDQQRIRMVQTVGGITQSKDYVGLCEFITENVGENETATSLTYLVGPYGVFAVVVRQDDDESVHYILKDHLGSWTTITDSEGNVEQELSFDAWGSLRDPETWTGSFSGSPMFDRGYTGHEHMTAFGLINMNGRCYDPLTSSFLSVDAYVEDPANAQAFNRYAYCGYNPLRYTDPTGWDRDNCVNQPMFGCDPPFTLWYSNDPNDVLWGRTVHPCANSSSGYINGTAVTSTGYAQGNNQTNGYGGIGGWVKNIQTGAIYYDETATTTTEGFLGITYTENNDYYGLLGDHYNLNTEQGRFWKDVYGAMIKFVEDTREYDPYNPYVSSFRTVDFSDVVSWTSTNGTIKQSQNLHIYENNNSNLRIENVLGIISTFNVGRLNEYGQPDNKEAMQASFSGWATAYPHYGKPYFTDDPVPIRSIGSNLPKGYTLSFSHNGFAVAYVHFLNKDAREYTKKQFCRVFGYTYRLNKP